MANIEYTREGVKTLLDPPYGTEGVKLHKVIIGDASLEGQYRVGLIDIRSRLGQDVVRVTQSRPKTISTMTATREVTAGHFANGIPVVPGHKIVEAGVVHVESSSSFAHENDLLKEVRGFRVMSPIRGGQRMHITSDNLSIQGRTASGSVNYLVDGKGVATAEMITIEESRRRSGRLQASSTLALEIAAQTIYFALKRGLGPEALGLYPAFAGFRLFRVLKPIYADDVLTARVAIIGTRMGLTFFNADIFAGEEKVSEIQKFAGTMVPKEVFKPVLPTAPTPAPKTSS